MRTCHPISKNGFDTQHYDTKSCFSSIGCNFQKAIAFLQFSHLMINEIESMFQPFVCLKQFNQKRFKRIMEQKTSVIIIRQKIFYNTSKPQDFCLRRASTTFSDFGFFHLPHLAFDMSKWFHYDTFDCRWCLNSENKIRCHVCTRCFLIKKVGKVYPGQWIHNIFLMGTHL